MKIDQGQLLSQLYQQNQYVRTQSRNEIAGNGIAELARQNPGTLRSIAQQALREARASERAQSSEAPNDTSSSDQVSAEPADEVAPAPADDNAEQLKTLAARYVELYEQNSGTDLDQDAEQARIEEVAAFYGRNSDYTARLEKLVSSLEKEV